MGLDQYAYIRSSDQTSQSVPPAYQWRKHAKLQEFMEQLFVSKTGREACDLNCDEFELTVEDLQGLEKLVADGSLPHSEGGFFYGHQFQEETAIEYKDYDLAFCAWALDAKSQGQCVYYSCWW